ncbi:hypothetical protein BKA69DRAFT_1124080 [Paraphysoderma sedebokerense]|nr:hypothetical protein BKA69DRAFT_1124080 [Paraphysoderma sedebokerense]
MEQTYMETMSGTDLAKLLSLLLPSLLITAFGLIYTFKCYASRQSSFNKYLLCSWTFAALYLVLFNVSVFVEPCHRSDSISSNPVTYDSCRTSWLRLLTIFAFALSASMFSITSIGFCSTILTIRSMCHSRLNFTKRGSQILQTIIFLIFMLYLITSAILFSTPKADSDQLSGRMRINVAFLYTACTLALGTCTTAAVVTLISIRKIKKELATFDFLKSRKSESLNKYIRNAIIFSTSSLLIMIAYSILIINQLSFPLSELRTLLLSLSLGTMTGFQLSTIKLIQDGDMISVSTSDIAEDRIPRASQNGDTYVNESLNSIKIEIVVCIHSLLSTIPQNWILDNNFVSSQLTDLKIDLPGFQLDVPK